MSFDTSTLSPDAASPSAGEADAPHAPPHAPGSRGASASLAPELRELVQELAVAVHKRGIYPATHPMQAGAVEGVLDRLARVLTARHELAIGVGRESLILDGHLTDPEHPLLRELAQRLHDHQLAGVRIMPGVTAQQVDSCIAALAESPLRDVEPLGVRGTEACSRWPHLQLIPAAFDHLALVADGEVGPGAVGTSRSALLWDQLARVAFAGGAEVDAAVVSPQALARSLESRMGDSEVTDALHAMLNELDAQGPRRGEGMRESVSAMVEHLSEGALDRLMAMGGDRDLRSAFLSRASNTLNRGAVLSLVQAAARQDGRAISSSVLRLLQKLARSERQGQAPATGNSALRRVVNRLLHDWTLDDPNPELYTLVLDELASEGAPVTAGAPHDVVEPDRMIELSLDIGLVTPSAEAALGRLVMREGVSATLQRLERLPASAVREELEARLINESMFREQLAQPRPDTGVVAHAIARLQGRAVEPILTAMERRSDADSGWCVDLLASIGEAALAPLGRAVPRVTPRVLRHVVTVFDRLDAWPASVDSWQLARHPDAAVRREVVRYLLRKEHTRDQAAMLALRDPDLRTFRQALAVVMRQCPPEAARLLMRRYDDASLGGELRARVVRAAATAATSEVRDWLVEQALTTRWLVGSVRLRRPSMEVVAAVGALAAHYADDPGARRVLQLAERSRDGALRQAATTRARTRGEEGGE
jgi:hypothetical protein